MQGKLAEETVGKLESGCLEQGRKADKSATSCDNLSKILFACQTLIKIIIDEKTATRKEACPRALQKLTVYGGAGTQVS